MHPGADAVASAPVGASGNGNVISPLGMAVQFAMNPGLLQSIGTTNSMQAEFSDDIAMRITYANPAAVATGSQITLNILLS